MIIESCYFSLFLNIMTIIIIIIIVNVLNITLIIKVTIVYIQVETLGLLPNNIINVRIYLKYSLMLQSRWRGIRVHLSMQ